MHHTLQHLLNTANVTLLNTISETAYQTEIHGLSTLDLASPQHICFLANAKYQSKLSTTQSRFVLISQKDQDLPKHEQLTPLVVKDAYLAFAQLSVLFEQRETPTPTIHPTAIISPSAQIGSNVFIGPKVVIGDRVVIGDNSIIQTGAFIEHDSVIGSRTLLDVNTVIHHHCVVGSDCLIHSGAVIGADGFGFAPKLTAEGINWQRIAQLGRVVIGNYSRIGANTTIDRGALQDTEIGNHVILDNLIQIGHGTKIGHGTAIAAHTAIAGSVTIGQNCIIGGCVAIAGHLEIVDQVTLTGTTAVTKSITEAGTYSSTMPCAKAEDWRKAAVLMRRLPDVQLEKRLMRLEETLQLPDYGVE